MTGDTSQGGSRAGAPDSPGVGAAGPVSVSEVVVVHKVSRVRNTLVGVLVVLSCLAVAVTGVAWWMHYSIFDSDGYIELIGPLGKDPEAIRALSDYIAGQVITATDLQKRTADALPPEAKFLAGPITGAVDEFIADGTDEVLNTPQAHDLWIEINRVGHDRIVALLRDEATNTYIQGGDVKLDTLPLISQVLVWLDGKLPKGALGRRLSPPVIAPGTPPDEATQQVSSWLGRPLPADFGQITLLQNDSLGPAQSAVRWFDALIWILLAVTIVHIAFTIWLSRRRRRTLIELGIGAAIALILTYVIVKQALDAIVADLQVADTITVLSGVVDASVVPLRNLTIWIVVTSVVVAVAAWIAGRRDVQVALVAAGRRVAQTTKDDTFASDSPITDWVARHARLLRLTGLVAGLAALLFATSSWLDVVIWVLAILVFECLVSLLTRQWPFGKRDQGDGAPA